MVASLHPVLCLHFTMSPDTSTAYDAGLSPQQMLQNGSSQTCAERSYVGHLPYHPFGTGISFSISCQEYTPAGQILAEYENCVCRHVGNFQHCDYFLAFILTIRNEMKLEKRSLTLCRYFFASKTSLSCKKVRKRHSTQSGRPYSLEITIPNHGVCVYMPFTVFLGKWSEGAMGFLSGQCPTRLPNTVEKLC